MAGFGGGGTGAPPADMLPLLRLRAPPPPSARLRLPGSRRRRRSGPPGPGAPLGREGGVAAPSSARPGPPRHVDPGERASATAPARVTCTGAEATWPDSSCARSPGPLCHPAASAPGSTSLLFICSP
nr:vegetative cell wall protein gp1-like [Bubalus bubalis]